MTDKAWKRTERRVAAFFGGRRVPITGRIRGDAPDVAHEWLAIECKERRELPDWLLEAMRQAEASARDGQLPIAVLHERGSELSRSLVVVRAGDFREWFGNEKPPETVPQLGR